MSTSLMAVVGRDGYGRLVQRDLHKEGVDASYLWVEAASATGTVLALITPDGQRYVYPIPVGDAAHAELSPRHIVDEAFADRIWLHTTGLCLDSPLSSEAVLLGMRKARDANLPVSSDWYWDEVSYEYDDDYYEAEYWDYDWDSVWGEYA